jgi:hypothetical protein
MAEYAYCSNLDNKLGESLYTVDLVLDPHNQYHQESISRFNTVIIADLNPENDVSIKGTVGSPDAVLISVHDGNYTVRIREEADNMTSHRKQARAINSNFLQEYQALGCLTSVIVDDNQIRMDCGYQDIANMTGLSSIMESTSQESTMVRDYSNAFHVMTIAQIKQCIVDMYSNGQQAYQIKWTREQQITQATTKAQLEEIIGRPL